MTTPSDINSVPTNLAKKRKTGMNSTLADVIDQSNTSLEKLTDSEVNIDEAMTQVDERWNKNKRRRTIEKMTQAPINDSSVPDDESPSEAGVIERLDLYNFMCHQNFSLELGPQTNFIIGRNGSGKSAVLTGISVALGAKATDTDRGTSLKNLIMHGKNVARAVVTLKNEGPEAYKPEEFGPKIIIERVLKSEGPHSLFVKNSNNKTISTKKKTIEEILDYFGITIANPMTILTQTEAKTFLAHSTDKDKFNSFMSGTRLKESFDNIKNIESNAAEIKEILSKNKNVHEELKQKFQNAKEVWNSFRDSDEYSKKKELLIGKKIWVEYMENEKLFHKAAELLKTKQSQFSQNNTTKASLIQTITESQKTKDDLQNGQLEEALGKYNLCTDEKNSAQSLVKNMKEELDEYNRKISNVKHTIKEKNSFIKKLDRDIEVERKRIEGSSEENIDKLKHFQEKQKEKQAELNNQREEVSSNIETINVELSEIDKKARHILSDYENQIRSLSDKIREAKHQEHSNRPESAFPSNVVRLMRDLKNQRFQNSISGPLGLYVELKKDYQKWGTVLETLLQRSLSSFLVTNHRDAQLLSSKVKFFGTGSEITVRQPEVFDFSQYKPRSNYPSIIDVLKIEDPNIKCYLVDAFKLHSTLLIPNRMDAQRELERDQNDLISSVICFVDNNVLRIYKKNGQFQSDPVNINKNNNFSNVRLRVEGDSLALRLERDLTALKKEKGEKQDDFQDQRNRFLNDKKKLQHDLNTVKQQIREVSQSIEKAADKLENLAAGTSKLDSLIDEKESITADLSLDVQKLEPIQHEYHKAQKGLENQIMLYQNIDQDYKQAKSIYQTKVKELQRIEDNMVFTTSNIRALETTLHKLQNDITKLEEYLNKTKEFLTSLSEKASEFCSLEEAQLTPDVTAESIDEEIRSINKYLQEIEHRQGITKEQAELNLINANTELNEVQKKFSDTINLYNKLRTALDNRLNNLLQTTYLTFQEVESVFITALRVRRFRGKIEFNVKKGTLTLKVATKENAPLRSVESFSGGEKSYGQIAFLFAIWGPMHSRIRGLDEFDVFMDNINRQIALKLILQKVSQNPKRQTIFITPLSVANIEGLESKTVVINEIHPPERANI